MKMVVKEKTKQSRAKVILKGLLSLAVLIGMAYIVIKTVISIFI